MRMSFQSVNMEGGAPASAVPVQMILYTNDAVEVEYVDNSRLQLSACGSSFIHHQPPSQNQHPLHGQTKIQQRTQFVTSAFKQAVTEALDFRNRFAEHPYVCRSITPAEYIVQLHADVWKVAWPKILSEAHVTIQPSGALQLDSMGEFAHLSLPLHGQYFTVHFLAKISQNVPKVLVAQSRLLESGTDQGEILKHSSTDSDTRWDYVWLVQHHSVHNHPECWKHPLSLLLQFCQTRLECKNTSSKSTRTLTSNRETLSETDSQTGIASLGHHTSSPVTNLNESEKNSSENSKKISAAMYKLPHTSKEGLHINDVPQSLSLKCQAQHLHQWKAELLKQDEDELIETAYLYGRIKVLFSRGIIYRLQWKTPRCVEILPGDGSIIRSTGLSGHFFNHYMVKDGKVRDLTYSLASPPPQKPGEPYSVARLISRASRLLQHLCQDGRLTGEDVCCWKVNHHKTQFVTPLPTVLLEECTIPDVGRFTAYSNGRIHVVFTDRTCLDMTFDLSKRVSTCKQHSTSEMESMIEPADGAAIQGSCNKRNHLIPRDTCRLLLPNGHYHHVNLSQPDGYRRYIDSAIEWANWVNTSPSDRYLFYKDTIYDPSKQVLPACRMMKLFNRFLSDTIENTILSKYTCGSINQAHLVSMPASDYPGHYVQEVPTTACKKQQGGVGEEAIPGRIQDNGANSTSGTCQLVLPSGGDGDCFSMEMVQQVLSQTSHAVKELDRFLSTNGETEPVQDAQ